MSDYELKKKIVEIISNLEWKDYFGIYHRGTANGLTEAIADTLIAAGIGDVKEAERRAEVAERALRNAAPRLKCRGGIGKGFCKVDECEYYHCNNDEGCIKAHLEQAEKELAEERKDD